MPLEVKFLYKTAIFAKLFTVTEPRLVNPLLEISTELIDPDAGCAIAQLQKRISFVVDAVTEGAAIDAFCPLLIEEFAASKSLLAATTAIALAFEPIVTDVSDPVLSRVYKPQP